jgi:hypothetical protein
MLWPYLGNTLMPKYEYVRLDLIFLLSFGTEANWLFHQPDCEYREDHQCFFILKGSKTHTMAALKYGDVFR